MKELPLTQDQVALVDDEDYEELSQYKWYAVWMGKSFYAMRWNSTSGGKRTRSLMHRVIIGAHKGEEVDHEDHNGLNNQKYNLRLASKSNNGCNRRENKNNTTGYKGVVFMKGSISKPYRARIGVNNRFLHIGTYATPEEAARAYDTVAHELHGEFACLNYPEET